MKLGIADPFVRSALRALKPSGLLDEDGCPLDWCPECLVLEDDGELHTSGTHGTDQGSVCARCGRKLPRTKQVDLFGGGR